MIREVFLETTKEARAFKEAFSEKNLKRVGELLASLATKKLGVGKFVPFLGQWYRDEFVSGGKKGVGYRYFSTKGYMIRFGFQQVKTKAKGLKESYSVNRIDFWIPDGKSKFDIPSKTIMIDPWLNIVDAVDEIFSALTGTLSESNISENSTFENRMLENLSPKLIAYARMKGLDDATISSYKSPAGLTKYLKRQGLYDSAEYRGFTVSNGSKEVDNVAKDLQQVEKQVKKVDPEVVFDDIEKLTELISKNVLKQNGFLVIGSPGIGKCKPGSEKVNIKGI